MPLLLSLPNKYINGAKNPLDWPGTHQQAAFTRSAQSHLSGTTTTDNGRTLEETIDCRREGSIYDDPNGFLANVQTKTSTTFKSKHFIGHLNGNEIKSGVTLYLNTQSAWVVDVVGFHCEYNSAPIGSGNEADACGRVDKVRICGVYADQNNKCRIMEMTSGSGQQISDAAWNSYVGTEWRPFSYMLERNNGLTVINNGWLLYGWIVYFEHKKTCGGGTIQKNCTGRLRHLRPIITPDMTTLTRVNESQLIQHWGTTLEDARKTERQLQYHN